MSLYLHGLGTAVPPGRITQEEGLATARVLSGPEIREVSWLRAVYAHSGIVTRYQVLGRELVDDLLLGKQTTGSPFLPGAEFGPSTGERMRIYASEAPELAVRAAAKALDAAQFPPESIAQLITVSCTGFAAPGVDRRLIEDLKLRPTVERTHLGFMGCHGALNGLRVANAFARANPNDRVLLCAVELCSLHYHYGNDADKAVANAIFADGAAAVVGSGERESQHGWRIAATGSCLIPNSTEAMHWRIGDHGFEMGLSRQIPKLIAQHLRPWIETWLGDQSLRLEDIRSWAIHPGGPKILAAVEESLTLSAEDSRPSRSLYAEFGNMSSPTVLFILERLREAGAPRPCVALGFGPGLVAEAVLFC